MVLEAGEIYEINCKGAKLYVGLAGIDWVNAMRIVELTAASGVSLSLCVSPTLLLLESHLEVRKNGKSLKVTKLRNPNIVWSI